jgi:tetratricopeptide (TPR) repeat protein
MITHEGLSGSDAGTAGTPPPQAAYFLNLLGDSHKGLGHHEAAIEAYRQASEAFRAQGAQCSYALCLFKIADSHLSLGEPWHAIGYLEACLPLLHDLGLTRHEGLARQQLDACQAELAEARLLGEGRAGLRPLAEHNRPAPRRPPGPAQTLSPYSRDKGRFVLCPGPTDSRAG